MLDKHQQGAISNLQALKGVTSKPREAPSPPTYATIVTKLKTTRHGWLVLALKGTYSSPYWAHVPCSNKLCSTRSIGGFWEKRASPSALLLGAVVSALDERIELLSPVDTKMFYLSQGFRPRHRSAAQTAFRACRSSSSVIASDLAWLLGSEMYLLVCSRSMYRMSAVARSRFASLKTAPFCHSGSY